MEQLAQPFIVPQALTDHFETTTGPLMGFIADDVSTFLGVPYAAPPVGEFRFMPPQDLDVSNEFTYGYRFGASAMQLRFEVSQMAFPEVAGAGYAQIHDSMEDALRQNEDCLYLNVWAKIAGANSDHKKPVMVMLHGGAFHFGSGSWSSCNGHNLAKNHDVVVVSINHRLNIFGFLNLAEIGGSQYAESGNVGMLDLVKALEWVRDNIVHFGGDPDNITICGQSGGGQKVCALMAMPSAKGLFHKAIVQSGPMIRAGDFKKASEIAQYILGKVNMDRSRCEYLQEMPRDILIKRALAGQIDGVTQLFQWRPIKDNKILPEHPFDSHAPAIASDIPLLIGFNRDENVLSNIVQPWWGELSDRQLIEFSERDFGDKAKQLIEAYKTLFPDYSNDYIYSALQGASFYVGNTIAVARLKSKQSAPVYTYHFAWESPVDEGVLKAAHSVEIPFTCDVVDRNPMLVGTAAETFDLATKISGTWAAFIKNGDPNGAGLPNWPAYKEDTKYTLEISGGSRVISDMYSDIVEILKNRD